MLGINFSKLSYVLAATETTELQDIENLFRPLGFEDCPRAYERLRLLHTYPRFVDLLPRLLKALIDSANPDKALLNFENFLSGPVGENPRMDLLLSQPRTLEMLVILFSSSQFLTDILLRYQDAFGEIENIKKLGQIKNRHDFTAEARELVSCYDTTAERLDALRRYQKRELLRIGVSDLFEITGLQSVIFQLSNLARAVVQVALELVAETLDFTLDGFTVIGLGKLGGRELNYSSDIDLIFLTATASEAAQKLGRALIEALTQSTGEGFLYRVDMRLRPWGSVGALVPSLDENINYLKNHAQLWEKQAMYKARFVAGDAVLAIDFLQKARVHSYGLSAEGLAREIHQMKGKIEADLRRHGKEWGEVKSGIGSIRDVEFVTQYLQIVNAISHPEVNSRNTLDGLARLAACKLISPGDYRVGTEGYIFLRSIEHHLQIMHYRQTHQLPGTQRELNYLARRLGFKGQCVGDQLVERYEQHRAALRRLYERYLGTKRQTSLSFQTPVKMPSSSEELIHHLARMTSAYAATFKAEEIEVHANMAAELNMKRPIAVKIKAMDVKEWEVTIVGFDYLGELSVICGLFFEYGLNIVEAGIFTYEWAPQPNRPKSSRKKTFQREKERRQPDRPKIVDVFRVTSVTDMSEDRWESYVKELTNYVIDLRANLGQRIQGQLAQRISSALDSAMQPEDTLLPIEIDINNALSELYTIFKIDAPDTVGFLYEFTNALSVNGIRIHRVLVSSIGNRVHDTLFLTDRSGQKIEDSAQLHQLRAATVLVKHFTHLLPRAPDPEKAMKHFREFVTHVLNQPDWSDSLNSLERPHILNVLAKLLGVSDFLWSDFLRMQHKNLFPVLQDIESIKIIKSKQRLQQELEIDLDEASRADDRKCVLNAFKDREMFRIDMRYILGYVPEFHCFSNELSDLVEAIVEAGSKLTYHDFIDKYGEPRLPEGAPCPWCVCALGKFGGRELGFASDIELIFFYEGEGATAGSKESIPNSLFFERMAKAFCHLIVAKHKGIFEIDLRLRPYGRSGSLAVSAGLFESYYAPEGPAWNYERQALVRLRFILGDPIFGRRLIDLRDTYVYTGAEPDVSTMRAMRERQLRQLVAGGTVNAKFSPGALVDLEYLVQSLQIKYGKQDKGLRCYNTGAAMLALAQANIIDPPDLEQLQAAYLFLRKLIEALRMVRGNARDLNVPPSNSKEFSFLARRLNYEERESDLGDHLVAYTSFVEDISRRLLGMASL